MTLDDTRFEQLASDTLDRLMEAIDDQVGDVVDVEMQNGVLTLKLNPAVNTSSTNIGPIVRSGCRRQRVGRRAMTMTRFGKPGSPPEAANDC